MTSDLGRSCFDGFVHITPILQAFSGLSSLPQGLFFGQKVRPRIFGPAFVRFCDFSLILGSQGSHIMIFNF